MMKIKSTAGLSLEDINDLIADNVVYEITIEDKEHYPYSHKYDIFKFLAIKRNIVEFLKNCPYRDSKNPNSEKEIFAYIYTKLALTVEYDELGPDIIHADQTFKNLYAKEYLDDISGLEGTLLGKKAVCSGFAETLRNLLAERGIEATYVSASARPNANTPNTPKHAWNQVKLDGEWFNCDVTHDRSFVKEGLVAPNFLKSNAHFDNYLKYPIYAMGEIKPATRSISSAQQQLLIDKYHSQILKEIAPKTSDKDAKQPGFFKSILSKLHIIKSSQPGDK
jgi:hypothetical protein